MRPPELLGDGFEGLAVHNTEIFPMPGAFVRRIRQLLLLRNVLLLALVLPCGVAQTAIASEQAPVCTLSASPAVIAVGASTTLTATCNPAASSYTWSSSAMSPDSPSGKVAPTAPTLYTVVGHNAAGSSSLASAAVYVCNTPPQQNYPGLVLSATAGNDQIASSIANDAIDGGVGVDTVVYSCNRASFVVTKDPGTGAWTVSSAAEGLDTLSNIERLRFADETLALDLSGNAGQVYRLYQAAFNRKPDNDGLRYWIARMDNGTSLYDVAAGFVSSAEFQTLYGSNPANADFLTRLYNNVLHRAPDPGGYAWWQEQLDSGKHTRITALAGFSESPENQAAVLDSILNGIDWYNDGYTPPATEPTDPVEPILPTVGPGEFKKSTPLGTFFVEDITRALGAAGSIPASVAPRYAVANYRLEYLTTDGNGREVLASALVSVPVKPAGALSPVLGYQHGTITRDADAPSNHAQPSEPGVVLASQGYIVLAADYVGYGSSKGLPHPYLMAIPSAAVVNDLLVAAKYWRQTNGIRDNKQLFLAGYSEGGYTTMAASRALQAANNTHSKSLVAVVPGSGPYQVYVTLDEILKQIRDRNPLIGALITPGFLKYMGSGTREWVRSEIMKQMLGSDTDVVFDPAFLDNFLADDVDAMNRLSNVHDWRPTVSMQLFHGRDDKLVSYRSSVATLQAMQARGTPGNIASLTDCNAQPADHLGCVAPYWYFLLEQLKALAKDL